MTKQLLSKIEGCYSSMSKGHKRITDYITENYDKAVFMTAPKLGDAVGVSESTVVRFASELGFCDQFYFSKKFKIYPGEKPLSFRLKRKINSPSD